VRLRHPDWIETLDLTKIREFGGLRQILVACSHAKR
jgi:hypothetical protein